MGIYGLIKPVLDAANEGKKVIVLCSDRTEAKEFSDSIQAASVFFTGRNIRSLVFHYDEYEPFSRIAPVPELLCLKMQSLGALLGRDDIELVIIPVRALVPKTIPLNIFRENMFSLKRGDKVNQKEITGRLIRAGYIRDNVVDMKGRFSVRGEIIDIFAVNQTLPARIIFLGSLIEKIRYFDIESQRGFKDTDTYDIIPVNEFIIDESLKNITIENIKTVASENGLSAKIIKEYIDELDASFEFNLREHFLPFMYNYNCSSVIDYIKASGDINNTVFFSSDKNILLADIGEFYQNIEGNYSEILNSEKIIPPFDSLVTKKAEIESLIGQSIRADTEYRKPDIEVLITKFRLYLKKSTDVTLADIKTEIERLMANYQKVIFLYTDDEQRRIFGEILGIMNIVFSDRAESESRFSFLRANTSHAFCTGNFLFLPLNLIIREKKVYEYEESVYDKVRMLRLKFSEIKTGDYVVHRDFGVGIYRGLKKISSEGGIQDYIVIEYKDKRLLYLPALSIDLINKYESGAGKAPAISPLGKEQWQKRKIKIKEELLRFAAEILRIKAERKLIRKDPLSFNEDMYERFCEGFEFTETPDQMRSIEEVRRDLLREYPMERIVCGDVGFGKTEIILRAAFIVASSGYQVAVLVPTTILAEQHFSNFRERLKNFPLRVEMLSRFVSSEKSSVIVKDIREGKVDIIIGTHKILSSGIQFRNLRLLVIDEEHKFGVEQKERLKRENPALDVLITTATPIPRTLHMGLSDLIDLSVLTTAPEGRIPVRTVISRFDEEVICNAVLKEVRRGGQVFFVNPRIRTIDAMAKHLKGLMKDVRIAVAHGRMPPEKIEEVMHDFYQKKYDLLVSTNIIGSGLDIPDVNTIIVSSAELFGLSELYQLRGRVGRRNVNAYAYFLFSSVANLNKEVKRKMDILYRHQGLGAGFNIASEDLELRGAGEILGKKQAGFIDGIGFDLYNELLEDALSEIQGVPVKRMPEVEIRVDVPVFIPDSYIDDVSIRLNFYHRFSAAKSGESVDNLVSELKDRFGEYPPEVENLKELSKIKIIARGMGIRSIEKYRNSLIVVFDAQARISTDRIIPFMAKYHKQVRISPDSRIIISTGDYTDIFAMLREWLFNLRELIAE